MLKSGDWEGHWEGTIEHNHPEEALKGTVKHHHPGVQQATQIILAV